MRNEYGKRTNKIWKVCVLLFISVLLVLGLPLLTMVTKAAPADLTISSARELNEFAQKVNNGNNYEGKVVKLANDIVFDGVTVNNFTPIGISTVFEGTFDGCGYTISGIDVTGEKYAALFANVAGEVKNVTVKDCSFSGTSYVAGIASRFLYGTITNCHVIDCVITQSSVSGFHAGGIVGEMTYCSPYPIVKNCSVNSTVVNKADAGRTANQSTGGIVGKGSGEIINCSNTGSVIGGDDIAGGICGWLCGGTIQNCFNTSLVTNSSYIGGIVGCADTSTIVANCYTSESACATNFGSIKGTEKNCKAYNNAYMQSADFLKQMNTNRGSNADWFLWEKRGDSVYPSLVKTTNINSCTVQLASGSVYNGKEQTPAITLTKGNYNLVKDVDYEVTYQDNINAGTATATISGIGMYTGDITKTFVIQKATPSISCKNTITKIYGSKSFSLGAKLVSGVGSLSYQSDNTKVVKVSTKGKISVKGVGIANVVIACPESENYSAATVVTTITVKPKKQGISVTRNGSKMKVTWKKDSKVSGYEVQYATNKSFKKNCKTITIKKKNKTSYTVKKLKKGKKYYVRVRSYKNVTFNGQKVKVTSAWSKVKKVSGY